jgi:protein FRA10AC1
MSEQGIRMPRLQAFELPFAYIEAGQKKQALVKVKVCERCARKVTYKGSETEGQAKRERAEEEEQRRRKSTANRERAHTRRPEKHDERSVHGRTSRSESPRRK